MVGTLATLNLKLLGNSLRRSFWRALGLVLSMISALGAVALVMAGLSLLPSTSSEITTLVTVGGFSVFTGGWALGAVLFFGTDQTLDPGRFALYPVRAKDLLPGLLLSSFLGVGGICMVLLGIGFVLAWLGHPGAAIAAIPAAVVGLVTTVLLANALTTALASGLASRRMRDLTAVVLLVGVMVLVLGLNLVTAAATGGDVDAFINALGTTVTVLGWTPLGWAWSLPAEVAAGAWGVLAGKAVLALVLVAGLLWGWKRSLDRALTSPIESAAPAGNVSGGRFLDRLYGDSPAGAIAARCLRYWRRDPRYIGTAATMVLLPVVLGISGLAMPDGNQFMLMMAAPMMPWLGGIGVAADLAYDGSALWHHATSPIRGWQDRLGRVLAVATIVAPLTVVVLVVGLVATGWWELAWVLGAGTLAVGLISFGASSFIGSIWQGTAPPPGSNPFARTSGGNGAQAIGTLLTMAATGLLISPVLAAAIGGFLSGHQWLMVPGLAWAGLIFWLGLRWGGRRLDKHWPEVLRAVSYERH